MAALSAPAICNGFTTDVAFRRAARRTLPRAVAVRSKTVVPMALKKKELMQKVAQETGMTEKEVTVVVGSAFDAIVEALVEGDKVNLPGFGTFEGRDRKARNGRNPQTGETILIPATRAPAFVASKSFKDALKATVQDK
mmetsp:Transcript_23725/g.51822  ORF Transcript_23725/g.51822 Transcript_23725/m.51822 type:complete len:139 (-) Transcript_23725:418-834(-)|eukprot:CAMPEP_0118926270 /NCGR_PEP_ID=MMETSP1169-20130426/4003_1 /TAXON_ID=36882 /ORGANISM="Pyramimonas obovata, Strain CCMP722" /LENGTH=138 /DNA_ID=CAMNT_0006867789 /DNA_START=114 /DNA_END=530 /DNA_ORIENTATION=-